MTRHSLVEFLQNFDEVTYFLEISLFIVKSGQNGITHSLDIGKGRFGEKSIVLVPHGLDDFDDALDISLIVVEALVVFILAVLVDEAADEFKEDVWEGELG